MDFVHKRYHFTPSFHSILLSINGIKILYQNIVRATTTEDSTPGGMEVRYLLLMYNNNNNVTGGANRIESNWNRIESKLIRNWVESVPNLHPIEIESNLNRIWSNRTSVPGDCLFLFFFIYLILLLLLIIIIIITTSQEVHNRIDSNWNRIEL